MQIPLALRALGRAPVRWIAAAVTRDPSYWVPSAGASVREWAPASLPSATTARAVRDTMVSRDRANGQAGGGSASAPPAGPPSAGLPAASATPTRTNLPWARTISARAIRRTQALTLALRAGYLSPALLDWCLRHAGAVLPLVRNLLDNPAVTPQDMHRVRGFLEERTWRALAAERAGDVGKLVSRDLVMYSAPFSDTLDAWLAAHHPEEPPVPWTLFMTQVIARHVADTPVAVGALALPECPAPVREAIRTLVRDGHEFAITRAVCRTAPRVMTPEEIDAAVLHDPRAAFPDDVVRYFDVLPSSLQVKYWREVYAVSPHTVAFTMAEHPAMRWPGLTASDLAPLLTHEDAPIRLAAIQLLAGLPSSPPVPARLEDHTPLDARTTGDLPDRAAPGPVVPHGAIEPSAPRVPPRRPLSAAP